MIPLNNSSWKNWAQKFPQKATAETPYHSPFRIAARGSATEPAEILIYDQIGRDFWSGDGMAAGDFAAILKEIDPKAELIIGINSPGGNVWDGLAIYNMIQARPGKTITRNDGMAASVASIILQAGTERKTNAAALVMIHRAWGMMVGNAGDAEQFKLELEKHDQILAQIYAGKCGKPMAEIQAAMDAETFYTGTEALAFGLVDMVIGGTAAKNLSAAPAALMPGLHNAAAGNQNHKTKTMENTSPAPAAVNTAPVQDLTPLLNAINALGDKLKPAASLPGTEPVATPHIQVSAPLAVLEFKNLKPGREKIDFIRGNYARLVRELPGSGIFAANTVDAGLANSLLSSEAVQVMRTKFAPISGFTRKISLSPLSKRQVVNVPKVSSAGSMQTNATNYETGDTTAGDIAVTVNEYSKSFTVSRGEQNLGLALAQYAPTNAMVLAEGVAGLVTALMTNANYGADNVIGTAANFDNTDLPAILALGKNFDRTNLLLDGGHLAYLLPTDSQSFKLGEDGAFGFSSIVKNNLWTGGATDICGFISSPDAIAVATGPAANLPDGEAMTQETLDIGGIQLTTATWFSRASHSFWGGFYIMFGCAVGDATQGKVLTTQ